MKNYDVADIKFFSTSTVKNIVMFSFEVHFHKKSWKLVENFAQGSLMSVDFFFHFIPDLKKYTI